MVQFDPKQYADVSLKASYTMIHNAAELVRNALCNHGCVCSTCENRALCTDFTHIRTEIITEMNERGVKPYYPAYWSLPFKGGDNE